MDYLDDNMTRRIKDVLYSFNNLIAELNDDGDFNSASAVRVSRDRLFDEDGEFIPRQR